MSLFNMPCVDKHCFVYCGPERCNCCAGQLDITKRNNIMAPNETEIEEEIVDKGLIAPRITPERINQTIAGVQYHIFEESQLTVCCITLLNGFNVIGESACASPENFDAEIGRKIAYENARDKIWVLEGYLLKEKIFTGQVTT